MDGFKNTTKMKYFKEGGFVTKKEFTSYEKKEDKREEAKDKVKDVKMVKAGVRQHETALHKGEPKTELKLKTGGRAKKATGTVKKFEKASGQYGAKKTAEDKKNIKEAKKFVPAFKAGGKACAESAAKYCGGKSVQKYNEGKSVKQPGASEAQQKFYDTNMAKADKKQKAADYEAVGSRGDAARKGMEEGRMDALGNAYKKGGKAKKLKKYADGGTVLSDEEKAWLGGADATDPFILARMKSALGDKKPAASPTTPVASSRPNPAMIEDESGRGNVTAAQQLYNQEVPGSGISTPAAAPAAPVRRAAPALPPGPSADERLRMRNARPYAAPNVEQDSGVEYPIGRNPVPASYGTDTFRKGAKARQIAGKSIGDFLGLNKNRG